MKRTGERDWGIALLMLSVAAMSCFEASDGDLGFHLATGREVLRTGHIPSLNVLSFGEPTHVWLLHQWLPAVLFEWLWQRGGIAVLIALKMLIVSTIWSVVYTSARWLDASREAALLACLGAACASAFRFELRPYLFTHLTLALTVLSIIGYVRASSARQRTAALVCAAMSFIVGAQLHAGALDSLIVMLLFAFGCSAETLLARVLQRAPRAPSGMRAASAWLITSVAALSVAALALQLYHPLGARILWFPLTMARDTYWGEHLVEFRHAWHIPVSSLIAYWVWLLLFVCTLPLAIRTQHGGWNAIALAYAIISLVYVRMVFAFAIVSAPLMAASWSVGWQALPFSMRRSTQVASMLLFACIAPLYVYRDHSPGFGLASWTWPSDQFAFIRDHALKGRAFVSDAWAGPFLGFFYPERKAFFDTRLEAYSQGFAQDVYQRIRYGRPGWDALLDRYQVDIVLLRYTTPGEAALQHGQPNLRQLLVRDARYSLINFDDVGELFVRRTPDTLGLINDVGMVGVDPDRRQFLWAPALTAHALLRAAASGNHSSTLLGLTALAVADAGDAQHAALLLNAAMRAAPDDSWLAGVRARLTNTPH